MKKIPRRLQAALWSYDIEKMDTEGARKLVIRQVLNYGDWNDLKWLWRTYSKKDIREVVEHPGRGIWFEDVLNFWCLMLRIKLPRAVRKRAIFSLDPTF
ncbi:MAG: hypothetical protein ACE5GG_03550 [Candidatus Omnitrophota bacterium]